MAPMTHENSMNRILHELIKTNEVIAFCIADTNLRILSVGNYVTRIEKVSQWLYERTADLQKSKLLNQKKIEEEKDFEHIAEQELDKALEKSRRIRGLISSSSKELTKVVDTLKYQETEPKQLLIPAPKMPFKLVNILIQLQSQEENLISKRKEFMNFLLLQNTFQAKKPIARKSYNDQINALEKNYKNLTSYYKELSRISLTELNTMSQVFPEWFKFYKARKHSIELKLELKELLERLPVIEWSSSTKNYHNMIIEKVKQKLITEKLKAKAKTQICQLLMSKPLFQQADNLSVFFQLRNLPCKECNDYYISLSRLMILRYIKQKLLPLVDNNNNTETQSIEKLMILRLIHSIVVLNGKQIQPFFKERLIEF